MRSLKHPSVAPALSALSRSTGTDLSSLPTLPSLLLLSVAAQKQT